MQKAQRAVVILDELPWMATPKSGLIPALDHIWNTQLSTMPEVILVVCGSAASLCFSESGVLRTEFARSLFRALFGESDIYEKIVRTLAKRRGGVPRTDLLTALKAESGGSLNRKLGELEEAGFIARITPYDKRRKNALYRIIDPYVYFYLAWVEKAPKSTFYSTALTTRSRYARSS